MLECGVRCSFVALHRASGRRVCWHGVLKRERRGNSPWTRNAKRAMPHRIARIRTHEGETIIKMIVE